MPRIHGNMPSAKPARRAVPRARPPRVAAMAATLFQTGPGSDDDAATRVELEATVARDVGRLSLL